MEGAMRTGPHLIPVAPRRSEEDGKGELEEEAAEEEEKEREEGKEEWECDLSPLVVMQQPDGVRRDIETIETLQEPKAKADPSHTVFTHLIFSFMPIPLSVNVIPIIRKRLADDRSR